MTDKYDTLNLARAHALGTLSAVAQMATDELLATQPESRYAQHLHAVALEAEAKLAQAQADCYATADAAAAA